MSLRKFIFITAFPFLFSAVVCAQTDSRAKAVQIASKPIAQAVKFSPAYAELLLRKTEREAELEEFLLDYTDEFPKVKEIKFELDLLQKQMEKVLAIGASDAPKLSLALGKLLVRKTELEVDYWNLLKQYNADHPEVKRAKRKIEVYEKAVKEILP
jgi:uncharacterized protein involved in exopolysaccharide biosynthesis